MGGGDEMGLTCSTQLSNNSHALLVWKPERKRSRCMWECNIKMDLKPTGFEDVDWIHMAH